VNFGNGTTPYVVGDYVLGEKWVPENKRIRVIAQ